MAKRVSLAHDSESPVNPHQAPIKFIVPPWYPIQNLQTVILQGLTLFFFHSRSPLGHGVWFLDESGVGFLAQNLEIQSRFDVELIYPKAWKPQLNWQPQISDILCCFLRRWRVKHCCSLRPRKAGAGGHSTCRWTSQKIPKQNSL